MSRGDSIRSVREALGMTQAQLARRLGIAQSSVARLERDEATGNVMLSTLSRAAEALECRLAYVLIPAAGSHEDTVRERAATKARKLVLGVDSSMRLEGQGVSDEEREVLISETARDLLDGRPASIWDDDD